MDTRTGKTVLVFLSVCLPITLVLVLSALYPPHELSPSAQGCRMSWMSPSYILQPRLNTSWAVSGRYRLWLYREAGWDGDDKPSGSPVLFIPGNAGSFKQVRSIASSASRQYWTQPFVRSAAFKPDVRPLDCFALDSNEELSAWDAPTLSTQAAFAVAAVPYILSLYSHHADPPKEVLVIGHSMGGVVTRLMLSADPRPAVSTVISLSAPHAFPPLPISRSLERLYQPMVVPDDVLFLSLCGGSPDIEFPAEMCSGWEGADSNWTRWSTGIEGVWTGVGHREMVWCHQVRWRVARAALELVALKSMEAKRAVMEHWFSLPVYAKSTTRLSAPKESVASVEDSAFSFLSSEVPDVFESSGRSGLSTLRIMHPLTLSLQLESCSSLGACQPAEASRRQLLPYPPSGEPFPRPGEGAGEEEGVVFTEVDVSANARISVRKLGGEGWLVGAFEGDSSVIRSDSIWKALLGGVRVDLPSGSRRAMLTSVQLLNLPEHALLVYRIVLHASNSCDDGTPMMPMLSTSSAEGLFHPHALTTPSYITSHLASAPFMPIKKKHLSLDLWGTRTCDVESMDIHLDIWASLGRVFGRYRVLLVAWSAGVAGILNLVAWRAWDAGAPFPTVPSAYLYFLRQILPILSIVVLCGSFLPLPASWLLGNSGFAILAPLSVMLLAVSTLVVALSWIILQLLISLIAFPLSFMKARPNPSVRLGLRQYISIGAFSLLIAIMVPSHFSFLVAFVIHLYTTARSYTLMRMISKTRSSEHTPVATHYAQSSHLLLFLFWLLPLTAPFALVWIRTLAPTGLPALFTSDRDGSAVVCVLISIANAWSGKVWDRANHAWRRWATLLLLAALSSYAFLLGARYTYGLYEWVELSFIAVLIRSPRLEPSDTSADVNKPFERDVSRPQ